MTTKMGWGKIRNIDLGQDNQAQVVFSIIISNLDMQLIKFRYESFNLLLLLVLLAVYKHVMF